MKLYFRATALLAVFGTGLFAQTFTAASASPFTTGTSPVSIVTGDFNSDGKPDYAVANYTSGTVSVFLGNGAGGFSTAPGSPFAAGANPRSIAVGDFNGDQVLDLVVVNQTAATVTVLVGNGAGKFTAVANPSATGLAPYSVVVADFNSDGKVDVAVANSGSNSVSVLLGNGTGVFASTSGPFTVGTTPESIAIGDFNGDGKFDLAVANFGGGVSLLLGDGTGVFAAAPGSPFAAGTNPQSVTVADLNGDGKADLAIANAGSNNVTVLLGDGAAGFSAPAGSPFTAGTAPYAVTAADFNGDGNLDLAIANSGGSNLTLLSGNGTGGFATAPGSPFSMGASPQSVAVADFNGDRKPDLVIANQSSNNATVLLNALPAISVNPSVVTFYQGAGQAVPASIPVSVSSSTAGSVVTVASTQAWLVGSPTSGATGSVLADSLSASQGALLAGSYSGYVRFSAPGFFAAAAKATFNVTNPSGALVPGATFPSVNGALSNAVAVGDFNGDGKPDFAIANAGAATVSVYLGDGIGGFTAAPTVGLYPYLSAQFLVAGDFNGDGRIDLLVLDGGPTGGGFTVLRGDGAGGFTGGLGSVIAAGLNVSSIGVGDFNGDGIPDVAIASESGNSVVVLLADGRGSFTYPSGNPFSAGAGATGTEFVAVGDFNGDGKADLALANNGSSNVSILLGNGNGGFSLAPGGPIAVGSGTDTIAVADLNGDGKQDLVVGNFGASSANVLLGDGTGKFSPAPGSPFATGASGASIAIADFNGDGKPDLAIANYSTNNVSLLFGDGTGTFPPGKTVTLATGLNPVSLAVADFNGDGRPDLVVANQGSLFNSVFLGALTVPTSSILTTASPANINVGTAVPLSLTVSDTVTAFNGPTGTVTFSDGGTAIGTAVQASSPYSFNAANLSAGVHNLTANYAGDTSSFASTSNTVSITVTLTAQTITFAPPVTSYLLSAGSFAVSGTASSGLAVSFASTTLGVCTVAGTTVTILTSGACIVQATQTGNASYAAAMPVPVTFSIGQLTQTITFAPALTTYSFSAGSFGVSATATSGLAVLFGSTTASICSVSGSTVSIVTAGLCNIQATQAGNSNYSAAALVSVNFTVAQASESITFAPALTTYPYSAGSFTVSATASSTLAVTFTSATPGVCSVTAPTVTIVTAGTCTIQATQPGNANYTAAVQQLVNFSIGQLSQVITFAPVVTTYSFLAGAFPLTATSTSGLAVSFTSATPLTCTVTGTTVTILGAGSCTVQASQAGNVNYAAAPLVPVAFTVTPASQTIIFGALAVHTYGDAPFALSASASSGLAVAFSVTSGPCSVNGAAVTITGAATCSITANQAGNPNYAAAAAVAQTLMVRKAVATVTANNVNVTLGQAVPTLAASYAGFVNSDTAAVVTGAPGLTTTATAASAVGVYPIVVSAGTLSAANYSFTFVNGTVTVSAPYVPPVVPPASFFVAPSAVTLQYMQGTQPALLTQTFQEYATQGVTVFSVTATPAVAWLALPVGGSNAPASFTISLNAVGLAVGTYQTTLTFASSAGSQQVPVTLNVYASTVVAGPPVLPATAVENSASFLAGVTAPNTILTVFGSWPGCASVPLVSVNGTAAAVLFANASQVNLVTPGGWPGFSSQISISCGGTIVDVVTIPVAQVAPAAFTATGTGTGQSSVINANGSVNSAANPAVSGSYISVYVTGFGVLNPADADGLMRVANTVTASIGGVNATVMYAGQAPGETLGLQQINLQLPAGVAPGATVPIVLSVGGMTTQSGITLAIR